VHAAAAEGLRLIALLQIVDEQLAGGQQVEFAIWWKGNAKKAMSTFPYDELLPKLNSKTNQVYT